MNAVVTESLKKLEDHRDKIASGQASVSPGLPQSFTRGMAPYDAIAQGDLNLYLIDEVPQGFTRRTSGDNQLVPGNTVGAKHCVIDPSTCDILDPPGWGKNFESLLGPVIVAREDTVVGHPTHGNVTILAGQIVQSQYQRVWEDEEKRARRQRD